MGGTAAQFAVALGIGLLIGLERERHKGSGPGREAAGIRTFALVSLLGAASMRLAGPSAVTVAGVFVAALALVGYAQRRHDDPGITTEVSLVVAFVLGALTQRDLALAAALAVVVTLLLAWRGQLHHLVRDVLTEHELHDALLFLVAAVVVLPLVPDTQVGPYAALNPFTIWRLVVIVGAINGLGYVAVRIVGPRLGLPIAGFASGFVSSTATIATMGGRVSEEPALSRHAVAAAVLSTIATLIQMMIVVGATSRAALGELAVPLGVGAVVAAAYGLLFAGRAARSPAPRQLEEGHAFDLKVPVLLAALIATITVLSAALEAWLGKTGITVGTAAAGLADPHAASASAASFVADGNITAQAAAVPILAALTANAVVKAIVARATGGRRYGSQVSVGLVLVVAAAWIAYALTHVV